MKNVWESCTFSDEIISGNLDVSKFAVELHNILDGDADKSYLDPGRSMTTIGTICDGGF